jgi:acyl-CoA reductase-like NAD-dependent aldehyde dehydrogenase
MGLTDETVWRGKIYSGGWVDGGGGDAAVIEPATGAELGRTGIATQADVAHAAQLAAAAQDAAKLAADSEYGLSLGILTRDVMRGLDLARQIPTGIVHINEQTVDDEPNIPFGGLGASGTGARFGGTANLGAFTDTRWVTIRGDIAPYPF